MSETVKKWGSIGILSSIGGTLLAASIIWLFKTVTEVKPLMEAVNSIVVSVERIEISNREQHDRLIELIELDSAAMKDHDRRIIRIETMCEFNTRECPLRSIE